MPEHLELPASIRLPDRRQRGSGPTGRAPRADPSGHASGLGRELSEALTTPVARPAEGVDPRRVFKIRSTTRISDDTLATRKLQFLGDTDDWTYVVLPDDVEASELRRALDEYGAEPAAGATRPLASFVESIDAIEPYGPSDRLTDPVETARAEGRLPLTVDVLLWPSADTDEARRRLEDVRRALARYGGAEQGSDGRPRSTVLRASCPEDALDAVLDLTAVESVRLPLAPLIEPSSWLTAQLEDFEVPEPSAALVGVIDDGVATGHPLLHDLVVAEYAFPNTHAWGDAGPHGTLVAGLAAYGQFEDQFRVSNHDLAPPARLVCARVLEPDGTGNPLSTHLPSGEPDHVVIEQAIRTLHGRHGVRVFNLSITDPFPYSGPHAGPLTERLDELARELDVVIVVSAGNRPFPANGLTDGGLHVLDDYPSYLHDEEARLAEPAPAANVVTVGSLGFSDAAATASGASYVSDHVVAGPDRPSPFSRTGPGVVGKVNPDLTHYGGDYVFGSARCDPNNLGTGVVSLNHEHGQRLFRAASGTSYSAPRVARSAAEIAARYPAASANLIRALLGVSADQPDAMADMEFDEETMLATVGAGIPHIDRAVESGGNRVVMTFDGEMDCDTAVIHPLPIPEDFARGKSDRRITVALAYDPPVRRQRREYLAGRVELDLFRNIEPDDLREVLGRQNPNGRVDLPNDRRRVKPQPGATLVSGSTLVVRRWAPRWATSMNPDDGDTYYVALRHLKAPWADRLPEEYGSQRYALAVELWDRARVTLDLYNLVQLQVRVPARLRVRT